MSPVEYKRLVENVRVDGSLTSAVLVCQNDDSSLEILSGHHRTLAAIEVGLSEVDAIVITSRLDEERKTAIQLSHNAVSGQDNPSVLADMYRDLGLPAKVFSGLTDEVLDLDKMTISGFQAGIKYEELRVAFLSEDRAMFEQSLKALKASKHAASHYARYADFDAIFDTIIAVKQRKGVVNSAVALRVMAELAMQQLAQEEASGTAQDDSGVAAQP